MNSLDALKQSTVVVADTGDFNSMRQYTPQDATTNPTLIVKALQKPEYQSLLQETVAANAGADSAAITDALLVRFGTEILSIIPGRVSTEVDARLSFDCNASIARAERIIESYDKAGVPKERVLIKVASTWEGIKAAETLQKRGINCNLTLMFAFEQAVACADAGVRLISPFVGRIYDWYKKKENRDYTGEEDPGVLSVRRIYQYYKRFGYDTEVMGASFRNTGQILALAGCDLLTISPDLLSELSASDAAVPTRLNAADAAGANVTRLELNEAAFRFGVNEDAMATEKLAEGIRAFVGDAVRLDEFIQQAGG